MSAPLKFSSTTDLEAEDVVICCCYQVTASKIREAIEEGGARTIAQVTEQTGAGGGCRGCHCRIQRMLEGLPVECGACAMCPGCGWIRKLCVCEAA